ncbi:MAG: response regulator [Alphaproteobacteria bacterium]|nr:response regulator [Alphaproteobacteria bacterium]
MTALNPELHILLVNPIDSSRKMLESVLRLSGYKQISTAYESFDAFRKFKEEEIDVVIAALTDGASDVIDLTRKIRQDAASPNPVVPVVAVCGPQGMHLLDRAREVGITEMIKAPYRVEDVATRLNFVAGLQQQMLENYAQPQEAPQIEDKVDEPHWPDEDESHKLTDVLLEHYLKHHEIVLSKLQFAQTATKNCIEEVRQVHQRMKELDKGSLEGFKDFDTMWQEIIGLFIEGGVSQEELFEIEKIITTIPKDIKKHYDELTQEDKEFMSLVQSLNTSAYHKARARVAELQAQPSPYNGKTSTDFPPPKKPATVMPWYGDDDDDDGDELQKSNLGEGEAIIYKANKVKKTD